MNDGDWHVQHSLGNGYCLPSLGRGRCFQGRERRRCRLRRRGVVFSGSFRVIDIASLVILPPFLIFRFSNPPFIIKNCLNIASLMVLAVVPLSKFEKKKLLPLVTHSSCLLLGVAEKMAQEVEGSLKNPLSRKPILALPPVKHIPVVSSKTHDLGSFYFQKS